MDRYQLQQVKEEYALLMAENKRLREEAVSLLKEIETLCTQELISRRKLVKIRPDKKVSLSK